MNKISRRLPFFVFALAGVALTAACAGETAVPADKNAPSSPTPPVAQESARTFKVLSTHDADAVFAGTREHRCLGMTSLCPDRCGSSGTLAVFRIEKYNAYQKRDKYGDPQTDEFVFMLQSTTGTSDVSPEIAARVRALKAGEKVRLVWDHIYVTDENGSRFPERVVRVLEPR